MYASGLSPFGMRTINPSFCVADSSLFSKPSLIDLTTNYPSYFQKRRKKKKRPPPKKEERKIKKIKIKPSVPGLLLFFIFLGALDASSRVVVVFLQH